MITLRFSIFAGVCFVIKVIIERNSLSIRTGNYKWIHEEYNDEQLAFHFLKKSLIACRAYNWHFCNYTNQKYLDSLWFCSFKDIYLRYRFCFFFVVVFLLFFFSV